MSASLHLLRFLAYAYFSAGAFYYLFWVLMLWDKWKRIWMKAYHRYLRRRPRHEAGLYHARVFAAIYVTLAIFFSSVVFWPEYLIYDIKHGFSVEDEHGRPR